MYYRNEWNPTGVPRAYFFTFRTYGTWLHGDSRGSVDLRNNAYGLPMYPPDPNWRRYRRKSLKQPPVRLNKKQRAAVHEAIEETCDKRKWGLLARNARTNHVHSVVRTGDRKPGRALNALKANATRVLRKKKLWNSELSPWNRRGSKRWLWTDDDVWDAIDYVNNRQ